MASLLLTVAVIHFCAALLGNVLKEILMLLIAGHGRLGIVAEAIVLLMPFVWVFALPMGLLTATLLVIGRFSADQELTAARASGISLISLIMPVLLLSLFCCVLSAWFSIDLRPRSRVKYLGLRTELLANLADFQWPEGRFINISTNYIFYAERIHGRKLENVMALCLDQNTYVEAPIGNIEVDSKNQQYVLNLIQAPDRDHADQWRKRHNFRGQLANPPISLKSVKKNQKSKPSISDMTFIELREELRELQQRIHGNRFNQPNQGGL